MPGPTPSQTIGPFFSVLIPERRSVSIAPPGTLGIRITVTGTVRDGQGAPVSDALVEIWQADAEGLWNHPDAPHRCDPVDGFSGFGRLPTDAAGRFAIETIKPGPVPGPDDRLQAPHLVVGLFARGVMARLVTRIYFDDEATNAQDPVLSQVPADRRPTLVAVRRDGVYHIEIALQGPAETVFFDV